VHAPTEDKIDDVKNSFYKELEWCSINSLNNIKILLDFNARVDRKDICKLTIGNESLHEIILMIELE
jgi:hypothetical protein